MLQSLLALPKQVLAGLSLCDLLLIVRLRIGLGLAAGHIGRAIQPGLARFLVVGDLKNLLPAHGISNRSHALWWRSFPGTRHGSGPGRIMRLHSFLNRSLPIRYPFLESPLLILRDALLHRFLFLGDQILYVLLLHLVQLLSLFLTVIYLCI